MGARPERRQLSLSDRHRTGSRTRLGAALVTGRKSLSGFLSKTYGVIQEAARGGAATMYPEFRKKVVAAQTWPPPVQPAAGGRGGGGGGGPGGAGGAPASGGAGARGGGARGGGGPWGRSAPPAAPVVEGSRRYADNKTSYSFWWSGRRLLRVAELQPRSSQEGANVAGQRSAASHRDLRSSTAYLLRRRQRPYCSRSTRSRQRLDDRRRRRQHYRPDRR